jgi:hypothetical protein
MDILLFGDILDPLHSTMWLDKNPGEPGYVRPWTDFYNPEFIAQVSEITHANLMKKSGIHCHLQKPDTRYPCPTSSHSAGNNGQGHKRNTG